MVIHRCLPFADERRSVKCLGSAAGVSFPSPPLPPAPTILFLLAQCPRALAPLGLKETETTATQARCFGVEKPSGRLGRGQNQYGVTSSVAIGHFHYGVILLQLLESFWFLFSHAN